MAGSGKYSIPEVSEMGLLKLQNVFSQFTDIGAFPGLVVCSVCVLDAPDNKHVVVENAVLLN